MRLSIALAAGLFLLTSQLAATAQEDEKKFYNGEKLKGLLITGGCCHNYLFQGLALTTGIEDLGNIEWEVIREGGNGTAAEIEFYDDPNWAEDIDIVVHNECFAKTTNPEYIRKITEVHRAGVPAVVIHCAMHTYRDAEIDDWRQFLGVTSKRHDHKSEYAVKVTDTEHPAMKGFPTDWVTPNDELYIIEKVWPTATVLATSKSEKDGKDHPVIWTNEFGGRGGTRVFGTSYGIATTPSATPCLSTCWHVESSGPLEFWRPVRHLPRSSARLLAYLINGLVERLLITWKRSSTSFTSGRCSRVAPMVGLISQQATSTRDF